MKLTKKNQNIFNIKTQNSKKMVVLTSINPSYVFGKGFGQ